MAQRVRNRRRKLIITIAISASILALLVFAAISINQLILYFTPVKDVVEIEAGSDGFTVDLYKEKEHTDITLLSNIDAIDFNTPGEHTLDLVVNNRNCSVELKVVDTTPPTAVGVAKEIYDFETITAEELVADVNDISSVTVAFTTEPPIGTVGKHNVEILLTDCFGNSTTVTAELSIIKDPVPPTFAEMEDLVIRLGDTISYKKGVSVTDNRDETVEFTVDNSGVDTGKVGTYTVTYTATDSDGNVATATRKVVIQNKLVIDMELVEKLAQDVLDKILTDGMSDHQKIEKIFKWVKKNMTYVSSSETEIPKAAYTAFTKKRGDCYNYFAMTKLLLNGCGIETIDVERYGGSSSHFWLLVNIGSGWYHYDTTPQHHLYPFSCFMKTDEEVWAYAKSRGDGRSDYYNFDTEKYPERATEKYSG